jgi:predicted nucleotidyltransferase
VSYRSPIEILFSRYRRQVLALLLLRPDETFYVREISRMTGVPAGSLHRELKLLSETGLLLRRRVGNQVRYQANRDCAIYPELAGIFRKTAGLVDVLREALAPVGSAIDLAFVFGSIAQGKDRSTSDVDVFVVGTVPFPRLVGALAQSHDRLGREVNPVVMPRDAVQAKYEAHDRFVTRVAREPKLFLIGTDDDFRQLTENRATQESRT